jgi:hypothetical protein
MSEMAPQSGRSLVERTGHVHRAGLKPLNRSKKGFLGVLDIFERVSLFSLETTPSGQHIPRVKPAPKPLFLNVPSAQPFHRLVPRMRPDCTCRVFSTKLGVVVHNFVHQLFDQLLSDRTLLLAG